MLILPQFAFMALLSPSPDYIQDVNETTAPKISPPRPELTVYHENLRMAPQALPQTSKFPMAQLLVPPLFAFGSHRKHEDEHMRDAVGSLLRPRATTDRLEELAEELLSNSVANQDKIKKLSLFLTHTLAEQFKSAHKLLSKIRASEPDLDDYDEYMDNYSIHLPSREEIEMHVDKPLLALTLLYRCLSVLDDRTKTDILVELDRVCNKKDENWDGNLGILDVIIRLTPLFRVATYFMRNFDPLDIRGVKWRQHTIKEYETAHEHDDYELQIKQCYALRIECMAQMRQIPELKRLSTHLINSGLRQDLHQMARSQKISPECREYFFERFLCEPLGIIRADIRELRKISRASNFFRLMERAEHPEKLSQINFASHISPEQQQDLTLGIKFFDQLNPAEQTQWAEALYDILLDGIDFFDVNIKLPHAVFCSKAFYDALSPELQHMFLCKAIMFDIDRVRGIDYRMWDDRESCYSKKGKHWNQLDEVFYHWSWVLFGSGGFENGPEEIKIKIIQELLLSVGHQLSLYTMPNDEEELEELLEVIEGLDEVEDKREALGYLIKNLYENKQYRGMTALGSFLLGGFYYRIAASLSPAGLKTVKDFANNIPKHLKDRGFMIEDEIESEYYGSVGESYIELFVSRLG